MVDVDIVFVAVVFVDVDIVDVVNIFLLILMVPILFDLLLMFLVWSLENVANLSAFGFCVGVIFVVDIVVIDENCKCYSLVLLFVLLLSSMLVVTRSKYTTNDISAVCNCCKIVHYFEMLHLKNELNVYVKNSLAC